MTLWPCQRLSAACGPRWCVCRECVALSGDARRLGREAGLWVVLAGRHPPMPAWRHVGDGCGQASDGSSSHVRRQEHETRGGRGAQVTLQQATRGTPPVAEPEHAEPDARPAPARVACMCVAAVRALGGWLAEPR
ncbi:MAG: hypothetical protein IJ781_03490 [Atopobiaceae bacterium]|nr:hypothetical protein [Atopobiaceae bacterium]